MYAKTMGPVRLVGLHFTPGPHQVLHASGGFRAASIKSAGRKKSWGWLGEDGKELKTIGGGYTKIDARRKRDYVAERVNWRVQKLLLHQKAVGRSQRCSMGLIPHPVLG